MKKFIAVLCAAVMMVTTATAVFALPSKEVDGIVDIEGDGEIYLKDVSDADKEIADGIKDPDKLKEVLGDDYVDGMKVIDVKELVSDGNPEFPKEVTFNVPGVTPDSNVAVLLYNRETGEWEKLDAVAGDGTITVTLPYLSLIAFVVDGEVIVDGVSPKTGEMPVGTYAALIALLALAGMGVVAYRSKRA